MPDWVLANLWLEVSVSLSSPRCELPNLGATRRLATALSALVGAGDLVTLDGPLASGKTSFAQALCHALGVPKERRVTSPTFGLVHELSGRVPIVHADLYRIQNARELSELGLVAYRDQGYLLLVEWGGTHQASLGGDALVVAISLGPRRATLSASGPRSDEILAALVHRGAVLDAASPARY